MIVKTRRKGREFTGVEIGASDVRRYFPEDMHEIELCLDHLLIRMGLEPEFWQGNAHISDSRLCAWLGSKNFSGHPGEEPLPLALIPSGKSCFRLQTVGVHDQLRFQAAEETVAA